SDIQYKNLQTESSFETDDIDLAESVLTEQINELTNASKENVLSS
ncbi:9023_t:CDS:1, partial [Scutellospora calospora]